MIKTLIVITLSTIMAVTSSFSQVFFEATCPAGQGAGLKVNSDFSTSLYCFVPPSSGCSNSLDFSQACNSQYAPTF